MKTTEYEFKRDNLLALMASTTKLSKTFMNAAIELAELYKIYNNEQPNN